MMYPEKVHVTIPGCLNFTGGYYDTRPLQLLVSLLCRSIVVESARRLQTGPPLSTMIWNVSGWKF